MLFFGKKRRILTLAAVLVLTLVSCGKEKEIPEYDTESSDRSATETVSESASEIEVITVITEAESAAPSDDSAEEESTEEESAAEEEHTAGSSSTETDAEEEKSEASSDAVPIEGEAVFFGHKMDARIAAVNVKTLSTPESGLYDVLEPPSFTADSVREMIESYSFPETAYLGGAETDAGLKEAVLASRNLEGLSEENFDVRYALITENAEVRSFPTMLKASDEPDEQSFDMLQESMFAIGEGVLVLHSSLDGEWLFVQGINYYGWIESGKAAFAEQEDFSGYLTAETFLVVLSPHFEASGRIFRLGTVIPYMETTKNGYSVLLPGREEDGSLQLICDNWPEDPAFSDGFLPYEAEALAERSFSLVGAPYGWGDTGMNYDCSSTTGLLYRCCGIYLPRNTSAMPYFAGGAEYCIDVSSMSDEEKISQIAAHPGALLVMKGHVMLFAGVRETADQGVEYTVVHNTVGYYSAPDGESLLSLYQTVESSLLNMYRASGDSYLSSIHTVVYF